MKDESVTLYRIYLVTYVYNYSKKSSNPDMIIEFSNDELLAVALGLYGSGQTQYYPLTYQKFCELLKTTFAL